MMRKQKRMKSWIPKFKFHMIDMIQCSWYVYLVSILIIAMSCLTQKSFFAILLLPLILYEADKLFHKKRIIPIGWNYHILWLCMSVFCTVIMFVMAYSFRVQGVSWDFGEVICSASEYVLTGKLELEDAIYFARYPNNQFWYVVLTFFFGGIHKIWPGVGANEFYLFSIAFACVMTVVSVCLLHRVAVIIWDIKKAFFVGALAWFCAPLYLWAMFAYTDTAGMLLLMIMLYCYVKAVYTSTNGKANIWLAMFGVFSAIGFSVKVTVFTFTIAGIVLLLVQDIPWKKMLLAFSVVLLSFFGTYQLCNYTISSVIPLEESFCDKYAFPLTHWIMMSLGYGGYQEEDVQYTISFDSYEKKKEANIKEIKKRLQERSWNENIEFFAFSKQVRIWGDATFASCDYVSRERQEPKTCLENFVMLEGSENWLLQFYMSLYYALILVGMFLSARYMVKCKKYYVKKRVPLFVCAITMLGIGMFQTIWECNSRYLVIFIPIMLLLASDGYLSWREQRR